MNGWMQWMMMLMWFNGNTGKFNNRSFLRPLFFPLDPSQPHQRHCQRMSKVLCACSFFSLCVCCFWNYLIIFSALWKNWLLASAQRTCSSPGGWIANVFRVMFAYRQPMLLFCTHVSICIFSEKNQRVCIFREATLNTLVGTVVAATMRSASKCVCVCISRY